MKLTKKEHIIPRMLLSQFVAADGKLRVYEKDKLPRVSRPENECAESNYFEFEFRGKKTNNRYENWLSQVEGNAAAILGGIMQRRILTRQEAEIWATFEVRCGPFWADQKSKSSNFKCDVQDGSAAD
jgi:hypothetical protein